MKYQVRCEECGRFCLLAEKEENFGYCNECSDEGWEEHAREMRELDPFGAYGDQSRYANH
jgi:hypothetical protein